MPLSTTQTRDAISLVALWAPKSQVAPDKSTKMSHQLRWHRSTYFAGNDFHTTRTKVGWRSFSIQWRQTWRDLFHSHAAASRTLWIPTLAHPDSRPPPRFSINGEEHLFSRRLLHSLYWKLGSKCVLQISCSQRQSVFADWSHCFGWWMTKTLLFRIISYCSRRWPVP